MPSIHLDNLFAATPVDAVNPASAPPSRDPAAKQGFEDHLQPAPPATDDAGRLSRSDDSPAVETAADEAAQSRPAQSSEDDREDPPATPDRTEAEEAAAADGTPEEQAPSAGANEEAGADTDDNEPQGEAGVADVAGAVVEEAVVDQTTPVDAETAADPTEGEKRVSNQPAGAQENAPAEPTNPRGDANAAETPNPAAGSNSAAAVPKADSAAAAIDAGDSAQPQPVAETVDASPAVKVAETADSQNKELSALRSRDESTASNATSATKEPAGGASAEEQPANAATAGFDDAGRDGDDPRQSAGRTPRTAGNDKGTITDRRNPANSPVAPVGADRSNDAAVSLSAGAAGDRAAAEPSTAGGVPDAGTSTSAATTGDQAAPAPPRLPLSLAARTAEPSPTTPRITDADQVRFLQRVARAFQTFGDRGGQIRLRLSPPELGSLLMEVKMDAGVMTARLEAETAAARTLLLDNLPALRERLAEQNIRVEQFDVDLADRRGGGTGDRPWEDPDSPAPRSDSSSPTPAETDEPGGNENGPADAWPESEDTLNVVI